ncbi:MAG: LysR substrate-binding domain-containing protein [Nocardioides alkalitolerans]
MELRDLEAFDAVADELHFGRAAARLFVAQPSLSSRIGQLERELGLQLFDRSTRSVTLTDAGRRLVVHARQVLRQAADLKDTAASIVAGEEGYVRLGFLGAASQQALSLLTNAVRREHPGIELRLQSQVYVDTALDLLRAGDLDLAFVRAPVTGPGLAFRVVEAEQVLCALPQDHRLATRESLRMRDLQHESFVGMPFARSVMRATVTSMCLAAGFAPRFAQTAPDPGTVMALVAGGAGVTITLSSMRSVQSTGIVYKAIDDVEPRHMFTALAWRADDDAPALGRVLATSESVLPTTELSPFGITASDLGLGH